MSETLFRKLLANEIECRVATIKENGLSLLLYKDARCDMNILDETVGAYKWKREHTRDNANCIVSIWNEDMEQWISKEDTGAESFTEKEKGLASDSFKRACFNWGIGRELYTAPFIWITPKENEFKQNGTKYRTYTKFHVSEIGYEGNVISHLVIRDNKGKERYVMGQVTKPVQEDEPKEPTGLTITLPQKDKIVNFIRDGFVDLEGIKLYYKVNSVDELNHTQAAQVITQGKKKEGKQNDQ